MPLRDGERQVAPTIEGVRADHVARYRWAAAQNFTSWVDVGCGIGYGSKLLAQSGKGVQVFAFDRDRETVDYAAANYSEPGITYGLGDCCAASFFVAAEAATAFEVIEHVQDPRPMLNSLHASGVKTLLASVPNEKVFPFKNYKFHHRHYTREEFEALLNDCGWSVVEWWGQLGPESEVERDVEGRTLIAKAVRTSAVVKAAPPIKHPNVTRATVQTVPEHIAIVGLGPSCAQFFELTRRLGGVSAYCDEVWGINAIGDVLRCDRIFHMDDVAVQELRAEASPDTNIAAMVRWLKSHPGPIYTSVVRDGYPGLVAFPLEDVLNRTKGTNGGAPYFNSTAAYAVAYAVHIGVKRISLFGIDYTLPNMHRAEKGRACVEFWLGVAASRGIQLAIPHASTLLDACAPDEERLYGFDCVDVSLKTRDDGTVAVSMVPKENLPTAEEIERRYDHSQHPNRLVAQAAE